MAMSETQEQYKTSVDWNQLPALDFQIGQSVIVKAKFIKTTQPLQKLRNKNHGPFQIIAQPGSVSFTLALPQDMHRIHLVFPVSMLESISLNTILMRFTILCL